MTILYMDDDLLVEDADGHRRLLYTRGSGACQTSVRLTDTLESESPHTRGFHLGALAAGVLTVQYPLRVLFIGAGGCIGPRQFKDRYPKIHIDVVDNNPTVAMLAKKFFWYDAPIIIADGREYLKTCDRYDLVILDAFQPGSRTPEWDYNLIRTVSQVVAINYLGLLPQLEADRVRNSYDHVSVRWMCGKNHAIIGS